MIFLQDLCNLGRVFLEDLALFYQKPKVILRCLDGTSVRLAPRVVGILEARRHSMIRDLR